MWNPFSKKEKKVETPPVGQAQVPAPEVTRPMSPAPASMAPPAPTPPAAEHAPPAAEPAANAAAKRTPAEVHHDVVEILKTVYDPEVPVNIYELGLIYNVEVSPACAVDIKMTLTSPMCPVAGSLPPEVENKVRGVAGVSAVTVELVWEPPWSPEKMSEASRLQLGLM